MNEAFKPKQVVNTIILSFLFLLTLFLFTFLVLIPSGQNYKKERKDYTKSRMEYKIAKKQKLKYMKILKNLKAKNKDVLNAFKTEFNRQDFIKNNKDKFDKFTIAKEASVSYDESFIVYDINATTNIKTPLLFYQFLNNLSDSTYAIEIRLPINFVKQDDLINTSFKIKVYKTNYGTKMVSVENKQTISKKGKK
jgi:hypothetical protein